MLYWAAICMAIYIYFLYNRVCIDNIRTFFQCFFWLWMAMAINQSLGNSLDSYADLGNTAAGVLHGRVVSLDHCNLAKLVLLEDGGDGDGAIDGSAQTGDDDVVDGLVLLSALKEILSDADEEADATLGGDLDLDGFGGSHVGYVGCKIYTMKEKVVRRRRS